MLEMALQLGLQTRSFQIGSQHLHADLQMPQQAALVGIIVGDAAGKFADLAEVVEQGPGQQGLAVQLGILVGQTATELEDAQSMLQQAARIGMVHALGRRAGAEGLAQLFIFEHAVHQLAPGFVAELLADQGHELVHHGIQRVGAGGHEVGQVKGRAFFRRKQAAFLHRELELVAEGAHPAVGIEEAARMQGGERGAQGRPDLGLHAAAGVGQHEPPVRPVARAALCGQGDDEDAFRFVGGRHVFDEDAFLHIS